MVDFWLAYSPMFLQYKLGGAADKAVMYVKELKESDIKEKVRRFALCVQSVFPLWHNLFPEKLYIDRILSLSTPVG